MVMNSGKGNSNVEADETSSFKFDNIVKYNKMTMSVNRRVQLPMARVKKIMRSSPEVENISSESIYLVAKATELFIQYLAKKSLMFSNNNKELKYRDIAVIVDREQKLEFLRELIPQKITLKEYKDMLVKAGELSPVQ